MIVCLCHGINDRKIKELADKGVSSVRELQRQCNAGKSCGACICEIQEMLCKNQKHTQKHHENQPAKPR